MSIMRDPLQMAIDSELIEGVSQALDQLPEPYRAALVLRIAHGLQPAAIAHALGRSPTTVRKQLERGLHKLRGLLPASLASAVAVLLTPARGIAAVRAEVLQAAGTMASVTAIATGGVLAMSKLFWTSTCVATLIAAWILWPTQAWQPDPANAPDAPNHQRTVAASLPTEAPATTPARVSQPTNPDPQTSHRLTVVVIDAETRATIAGYGVELIAQDGTYRRMVDQQMRADT